jgi:hypothetical protein
MTRSPALGWIGAKFGTRPLIKQEYQPDCPYNRSTHQPDARSTCGTASRTHVPQPPPPDAFDNYTKWSTTLARTLEDDSHSLKG